jgi:hypothetical protein
MQLMQNVTRAVIAYDESLRDGGNAPRRLPDGERKPEAETGGSTY